VKKRVDRAGGRRRNNAEERGDVEGGGVRYYSSGGSSPGLSWARVLGLGRFTVDLGLGL
jgi:hypothetical protein